MAVRGFCHVAIGVADPDRSLHFYRDVAGLTVSIDAEETGEERGTKEPVHRRAIYLRGDTGSRPGFIVLDYQFNRPLRGGASQMFDMGVHHFALEVDDVEAVFQRAKRLGAEVYSVPTSFHGAAFGVPGVDGGPAVTSLILKDPDGNLVQFDQWLRVSE